MFDLDVKNETLQPQRERLDEQFRRMKKFYNQVSKLQYFKSLIQVPNLPEVNLLINRKHDSSHSFIHSIESAKFRSKR